MRDGYGRDINYLRLSVTDLCNLRCVYCMPAGGVEKRRHEDILSVEELEEIAQSAGRCGISKIRLTGGEPACAARHSGHLRPDGGRPRRGGGLHDH